LLGDSADFVVGWTWHWFWTLRCGHYFVNAGV